MASTSTSSLVLHAVLPRGWLKPNEFEQILIRHAFEAHLRLGGTVVFEFPKKCRLPAGLGLWLLSFLNQLAAVGRGRVRLEFAPDDLLFGYLDRNGFLGLLSPTIETSPERPSIPGALIYRGRAATLVEIAPLHPSTSVEEDQRVLRGLTEKLEGLFPRTEDAKRLINHVCTALAELVQNVRNHSRSALQGYAVLQAYVNTESPRVQIGVSDSGVGIPASLREGLGAKLGRRNDAELILEAFREGLSCKGKHGGRGCGLHTCARLAAKYGSQVSVRTPSAHVTLRPSSQSTASLEAEVIDGVAMFAGTHIYLQFDIQGRSSFSN